MNKKHLILLLISLIVLSSANYKPKYSYRTYGNVANYFENENDFRSYFDFHAGDIVAEVGAGNGENMFGFTLVADSIIFYVQDIDTNTLSQGNFDKVVKHCKKLKDPLTNKYYRCIGTEKQTNLPDNTFDKIFLISTFHEFTFMDEMFADIYKKLKPSGQLYILETRCF
ncbi:MAG TPA: methyltransferase domain-containing protein, partial [Bacteroidia bacterium]|nr:methyltransferase domain-containing protein [Bacteroidia bacterium]